MAEVKRFIVWEQEVTRLQRARARNLVGRLAIKAAVARDKVLILSRLIARSRREPEKRLARHAVATWSFRASLCEFRADRIAAKYLKGKP